MKIPFAWNQTITVLVHLFLLEAAFRSTQSIIGFTIHYNIPSPWNPSHGLHPGSYYL